MQQMKAKKQPGNRYNDDTMKNNIEVIESTTVKSDIFKTESKFVKNVVNENRTELRHWQRVFEEELLEEVEPEPKAV